MARVSGSQWHLRSTGCSAFIFRNVEQTKHFSEEARTMERRHTAARALLRPLRAGDAPGCLWLLKKAGAMLAKCQNRNLLQSAAKLTLCSKLIPSQRGIWAVQRGYSGLTVSIRDTQVRKRTRDRLKYEMLTCASASLRTFSLFCVGSVLFVLRGEWEMKVTERAHTRLCSRPVS